MQTGELTPTQQNLTNLLAQILTPTPVQLTSRFHLVPLVMALNLCLPPPNRFDIGRQACAGEFLDLLLSNLQLRPYMSRFEEVGLCPICNLSQISAIPNTTTPFLLLIPIHGQLQGHVELSTEVITLLNQPLNSVTCQNSSCAAYMSRIPGNIRCTLQSLTIYWVGRNLGGIKCLRPVEDPVQSGSWISQECVVVLAHTGRSHRGGHWFTFIKEHGVWWRSDTSLPNTIIQNPFNTQLDPVNPPSTNDFTLDIFFFKM